MQQVKRVRIFVSGRVQGVGFREYTRRKASGLGLGGWTRNLPDGRVEILAEGDPAAVGRLVEAVRSGPPQSDVEECELAEEAAAFDFSNFRILRAGE